MGNKASSVYVIGEIGQNHNGSVDLAKLLVELSAMPVKESLFGRNYKSLDAVKLTKRDLNQELSASMMREPYVNTNSFGATYGEHREVLELNDEEHFEVYKHAKKFGLDFVETLCAPGCTSLLKLFTPDYLKVASRDLTNIPLLEVLAETKIPIIVSTGMADQEELDHALTAINRYHSNISILHCVSEYPTKPENTNLNTINFLLKEYGQYVIGYSDHTVGIMAPVAAVAMGAKIIEKHITLNRDLKGTDQRGSLGPEGIHRMMRDLRMLSESMGNEEIFICEDTKSSRRKLERSLATRRDMKVGEVISENDLWMLSPGDGFRWRERTEIIGKQLNVDLPANEIIYPNHLKG
ncbi:MAG: shikimate dehydrogenase [Bacteroidetes bacterium RIFCSPHIGHO2_02_FULL_44_7]|nr:MAG: shikimate dehydrogenase [Bacteroidetes bacterium RIFCSPHIGHO2_02_FULL_44_7]